LAADRLEITIILAGLVACQDFVSPVAPSRSTGGAAPISASPLQDDVHPFRWHNGYLVTTLRVGERKIHVYVDAASDDLFLVGDSVDTNTWTLTRKKSVRIAGQWVDCEDYQVPAVQWDAAKYGRVAATDVDRSRSSSLSNTSVGGLLGTALFRKGVMTVDYCEREIRIGTTPPMWTKTATAVPFRMVHHFIVLEGNAGDAKGSFLLDTGGPRGNVTEAFCNKAGIKLQESSPGPLGKVARAGVLPELKIGDYSFGEQGLHIGEAIPEIEGFAGTLANGVLCALGAVAIDFPNQRLWFKYASPAAARTAIEADAKGGSSKAALHMAVAYVAEPKERLQWFRQAADAGEPDGCVAVGEAYTFGYAATKPDAAEAAKWYRKAAEAGSAEGTRKLALLYREGAPGVPQDVERALKLLHEAALDGDSGSYYTALGETYFMGVGVTVDQKKAVEYFRKSAEWGDAGGRTWFAYCLSGGHGVPKDIKEAERWLRLAVNQGAHQAMFSLGWLYEHGELGAANREQAVKLYRAAAAKGNEQAIEALRRLGEK
jgi:TPR repeat protein